MKKIINWTFGSVFRTFGRVLAYILIGTILTLLLSKTGVKITSLLPIMRVSAATTEQWAINLNPPTDVRWFDCTSSTSCETQQTYNYVSQYNSETGDTYSYVIGGNTGTIATNGILLTYKSPVLINKDYVYNLTVYHCSNKNLSGATYNLYSNTYANRGIITGNWSQYTTTTTLSKYAYTNSQQTANYCYMTQTLFVSDVDTSWVFLKIKSPSSSITGYTPAFISIEVETLGIYKNVIDTIVRNAIQSGTTGLATSSQVTNAQNNINNNINNSTNSINNTINSGANQVSDSVDNLNDNINDDDSSEATSEINDFFSNFSTNNHGLTGIISAPLNAINSLTSKTCSPLVLPLPFVNQNLTLPCMRNIYVQNFGAFMTLYDVITLGIISYWVMVRIFNLVKDFKNPEHDEVEVMDL